ncbi:MAG: FeoA family protein [Candidatus Hydrogenedentota bacterium]
MSNSSLIDRSPVRHTTTPVPAARERMSLSDAASGSRVRVVALRSEPSVCQRLRELGFCELAEVSKLSDGIGLICQVCGSKVALSSRLADDIVVEPLPF